MSAAFGRYSATGVLFSGIAREHGRDGPAHVAVQVAAATPVARAIPFLIVNRPLTSLLDYLGSLQCFMKPFLNFLFHVSIKHCNWEFFFPLAATVTRRIVKKHIDLQLKV